MSVVTPSGYASVTNGQQKAGDANTRTVYHYQYTGWPDHGCPQNPGAVLNFVDAWNACALRHCPPDAGPVIVHCSAGIGRTGTIIAIDLIVNQLKQHGLATAVDVAHCVQMLREQRSGMVQTEQQYTFIYQAVAYFVQKQIMQMSSQNYTNVNDDMHQLQLQQPPASHRRQQT